MGLLSDDILKWNLELNGDSLQKELGDINLATRELEKTNKGVRVELQKLESQGKKNSKEWKDLDAQLKSNKVTIDANKDKMAALRKEIGIGGLTMRQLGSEAKGLRNKLNNAVPGTAEWKKYDKQLKAINTRMGQLRGSASRVNNVFGLLKRAVPVLSIAAAGSGIKKLTQAYERFEEKTANLSSLTGLQGKQLEWLAETAKTTSSSIVEGNIRITKSADDIVDAYTKVGSQRPELLKNKEALAEVTKDALILAQASKMELEPATEALTNIMNQFNAEADDSRRIINSVAAGSKAGAADIPYLSQAIEKSGTTMNLMNISLEQGIGLIEAVAPKYKKAEVAGNSLDKVLLKMKDKNIGYVDGVFDMNTAISELAKRFEAGETAGSIFGVEHAKMAEILVQSKDKFNEYTAAVTDTNVAIEQAITNTDIHKAKRQQAINSIHNTAIALGEKLAPIMTTTIGLGAKLLKTTIAIIDTFMEYSHVIIPMTGAILAYTVAVQASIITDKAKVIWTKAVIFYQNALKAVMAKSPWGLAAIALATIVAGLAMYVKKQKEAISETKRLTNSIDDEIENVAKLNSGFNANMNLLKKGNLGNNEKRKIIKKLNSEYGDYLENQITEKTNLEDLNKLQEEANKKLQAKIISKAMEEEIAKTLKESADAAEAVIIADMQIAEGKEKLVNAYNEHDIALINSNIAFQKAIKTGAEERFDNSEKEIKSIKAKFKKVAEFYGVLMSEIENSGNDNKTPSGLMTEKEFKAQSAILKNGYKQEQSLLYKQLFEKEKTADQFKEAMILAEINHLEKIKSLEAQAGEDSVETDILIWNKKIALQNFYKEQEEKEKDENVEIAQKDFELNLYKAQQDAKLQILKEARDQGLLTELEYLKAVQKIRDDEQKQAAKDKKQAEKDLKEKYDLYTRFATDVGNALGSAIADGEVTLKDFGKQVIIMALDLLKKQAQLAIANATIGSLAQADSIFTFGAMGVTRAAILTGLIEAAYQGVAGIVGGFYGGGFTGDGNPRDFAGFVHKKEFVANERATSNPTVRPFLNMINQAQVDGTIQSLDFNRILATQRVVEAPAYQSISTNQEPMDSRFVDAIEVFSKTVENGITGKWVYTEFEEVDKETSDIRASVQG